MPTPTPAPPVVVSLPEAGGYPLKRRPCSRRGWESERRRTDLIAYLDRMDGLRPDLITVTAPFRRILATRRYITEEFTLRVLIVVGRAVVRSQAS